MTMGISNKRARPGSRANAAVFRRGMALTLIWLQVSSGISSAWMSEARGQTNPSALAGSTIPTALPQSFMASTYGASANGCMGSLQSTLQSVGTQFMGILSAGKKGTSALNLDATGCPKEVKIAIPSACPSAEAVKQLEAAAAVNIAALECKAAKLEALNQALACIQQGVGTVNQQVGALNAHYAAIYQNASLIAAEFKKQTDMVTQKGEKVDVRMEEIGKAIGETNALKKQIDSQIQQASNMVRGYKDSIFRLDQAKKTIPAAHAQQCFKEKVVSSYQCTTAVNAAPELKGAKTAYEAMLCQYEQQLSVVSGRGGMQKSTSASSQGSAANAKSQLQSVLDGLLGKMPTQTSLTLGQPSSNGAPAADPSSTQPTGITSMKDVDAYIASGAFSALPSTGSFNPSQIFRDIMASCFKDGEAALKKQTETGDIHNAMEQIEVMEETIRAQNSTLLGDFTTLSSANGAALSTVYSPYSNKDCESGDPSNAVKCMKTMKTILDNQLQGKESEKPTTMDIGGATLDKADNFSCTGLMQCSQLLANKKKELADRGTALKRDQEAFNTQMSSSMNSMAKTVLGGNPQAAQMNALLNNDMTALNAQLRALGVGAIKFEGFKPPQGQLEKDDNGVTLPPDNVLEHVGGQMTPPLIDSSTVDGSSLEQALADAQSKRGEASGVGTEIAAKVQECKKEKVGAAKKELIAAAQQLEDCKFYIEDNYCGVGEQGLASLLDDIGDLTGTGFSGDEIADLESGVSGTCVAQSPTADAKDAGSEQARMERTCRTVYSNLEDKVGAMQSTARSFGEGSNSGRGD